MESLYRRYHHRIKALRVAIVGILVIIASGTKAQNIDEYEKRIYEFLYFDYIELLEKSKDYSTVANSGVRLAESMNAEIKSLTSVSFNTNALIEYDRTSNNGSVVVIDDRVVPFLVNYAGRNLGKPTVTFECIVQRDQSYLAYFFTTNEISTRRTLRKAIFRANNNKLELRRISFGDNLPLECKREAVTLEDVTRKATVPTTATSAATSTQSTEVVTTPARPSSGSTMPSINIRDQLYQNGIIYLYGFVNNPRPNGILTDMVSGAVVNVSSRDGYFVVRKAPGNSRYMEVPLKYQYGQKFITVKKLVLID